ncbi:MAG: DUF2142 domain-containing protein [Actinobacteria bacterium]|nr:MAG: DUF2142 domain-containing protein [Actinomycetota bacterium]
MPNAGSSARFGVRRVLAVAVAAAALWVALAAWALSSPVGSTPDEDYHLATAYCAAGLLDCQPDGSRAGPCYGGSSETPGTCQQVGRLEVPPGAGIRTGWYPPFYRTFMSWFVQDSVGGTALAMRLVNVTLTVAAVAGSIALTSRRFRLAVAVTWVAVSGPLVLALVSSLNPNAWSVLGLGAMWGPLLSVLVQRRRHSPWLVAGRLAFVEAVTLMALGSRTEGAPYVLIAVAAFSFFVLIWPGLSAGWFGRLVRQRWARLAVLGVLAAQAVAVFLTFSGEKSDSYLRGRRLTGWEVIRESLGSLPGAALIPGLPRTSLGCCYDVQMPPVVGIATGTAIVVALVLGLRVMYLRKGLAFTSFLLLTGAFLAYVWVNATRLPYQPRYFAPLLFLLVGIALVGPISRHDRRRVFGSPWPLLAMAVLAATAATVGLLTNVQRYAVGMPRGQASVAAVLGAPTTDWWPAGANLPPWAVWTVGSTAFLVAVLLGLYLAGGRRLVLRTQAAHRHRSHHAPPAEDPRETHQDA